ncbi:MAG: GntR family transcriptional regulator [Phascolarctobacterium sp.]|nr:GntR family transcriptional regulator [Candidatus Phascolarctobacterium equi]
MERLQPIDLNNHQPLREAVCNAIRDAINNGVLKPGDRLMEIQLAEELGISRTPVREAIRKLEMEGFVVMIPRRGTYVTDISLKDVTEIYEIRISLDMLAASLAAERINDDELEEMDRQLLLTSKYNIDTEMEKIVACDSVFHDVLYRAARNERLVSIINNLRDQLTNMRGRTMAQPGRLAETLTEHRILLDAIASRDPEAAAAAARSHIENAERTLMESLGKK